MSGGSACKCPKGANRRWAVLQRQCNHSAFNGYHWTPSEWSDVTCYGCQRHWRTKAAYVSALPDYDIKLDTTMLSQQAAAKAR